MSTPWAPSAAREAVRAALYRIDVQKPTKARRAMVTWLRGLLAADAVFAEREDFGRATLRSGMVPRELLAVWDATRP